MKQHENHEDALLALVKQVGEYADGRGVNFMDALNLIMITHLQTTFPAPARRSDAEHTIDIREKAPITLQV